MKGSCTSRQGWWAAFPVSFVELEPWQAAPGVGPENISVHDGGRMAGARVASWLGLVEEGGPVILLFTTTGCQRLFPSYLCSQKRYSHSSAGLDCGGSSTSLILHGIPTCLVLKWVDRLRFCF